MAQGWPLANGQTVEMHGYLNGSLFIATRIEVKSSSSMGAASGIDNVYGLQLQGLVNNFIGVASFGLGGLTVDARNATFVNGTAAQLANGILIASPEYNASLTPLLKNTIDWLSQDVGKGKDESGNAPFEGKIGGLMGASNGGFGTIRALPHVSYILSNLGVFMLPVVAVPAVGKAFDENGVMTNERAKKMLSGLGARLAQTIVKLG